MRTHTCMTHRLLSCLISSTIYHGINHCDIVMTGVCMYITMFCVGIYSYSWHSPKLSATNIQVSLWNLPHECYHQVGSLFGILLCLKERFTAEVLYTPPSHLPSTEPLYHPHVPSPPLSTPWHIHFVSACVDVAVANGLSSIPPC